MLLFMSFSACLVVPHIVFWAMGYRPDMLPKAPFEYVASENYGWELLPGMDNGIIRTNSKGFRENKEISETKSEDFRLVVLGDSVGFGLGLREGETIADMLEKELANKGLNAEAINMCVPAWGTRQYLKRWEIEGKNYDADRVLVVLCFNDPVDDYFMTECVEKGVSELNAGIMRTRTAIARYNNKLYRWMEENYAPFIFFRIRVLQKFHTKKEEEIWEIVSSRRYDIIMSLFMQTLQEITDTIGRDKIVYLVQSHENHVENTLGIPANQYPFYYPEQETLFRDQTLQYFHDNKIAHVDGLDAVILAMRNNPKIILRSCYGWFNGKPDGIHYSATGSDILAKAVCDIISPVSINNGQ